MVHMQIINNFNENYVYKEKLHSLYASKHYYYIIIIIIIIIISSSALL
jgi:hypothetical protein